MKLIWAGLITILLGLGPIGIYTLLGPKDGNPVGLGLLTIVLVPLGLLLFGIGVLGLILKKIKSKNKNQHY